MVNDLLPAKKVSTKKGKESSVIEIRRGSTTVKIYKVRNRNRAMFTATWFIGGKRHRRNFTDEKAARKEAGAIADKVNRGQAQALSLTGTDRESYLHSRSLAATLGIPLHTAIEEYVAVKKLLDGKSVLEAVQYYLTHAHRELPRRLVSDLQQDFLKQHKADGSSERYLQDIRSRLGRFADAFKMDIASVTIADMDRWIRSLGVSARTRVNFRTLLITFFHFARQNGYLPKGMTTAADDLPLPKTEDEEIEIYNHDELQKLISKSDSVTLPVLCLGAFAGLRTAEIERLTWDCIKWGEKVIEVGSKTAKTRQRRLIPILPPLRKALWPVRKNSGPIVTGVKLQLRLRQLAEDAKVPRKANGLRHSFASYRVAQLQHVDQVALEMGNSTAMVFEHYRQLVNPTQAKRWWNSGKWQFPAFQI